MKININGNYYEDDFYWKYYSCLYDLPEDGLELMRKSILACAKVSNNPIYQQLINKYNWND